MVQFIFIAAWKSAKVENQVSNHCILVETGALSRPWLGDQAQNELRWWWVLIGVRKRKAVV